MNEPVLGVAGVAAVINALLLWSRMMGWITWTDDQFNQFLIIVGLVLPMAGAFWARSQVTPTAKPRAENTEGNLVTLVPADGSKLPAKE